MTRSPTHVRDGGGAIDGPDCKPGSRFVSRETKRGQSDSSVRAIRPDRSKGGGGACRLSVLQSQQNHESLDCPLCGRIVLSNPWGNSLM